MMQAPMMHAMTQDRLRGLLAQRRPGFSLPQAFYVDEGMFRADLAAVFETDWLFACSVAEIQRPGDYVTLVIGVNSVVVLPDREGQARSFHHSGRPRGFRPGHAEARGANRRVGP